MRRMVFLVGLALAAPGAALAQQQAVTSQLITLHDDLRLRPEQDAAWKAYTVAIAPSPQMEARHRSAAELLPLVPTPRRIALIEASMADDEADFRRQGQAVMAFYGQLSPDQQRTFDRETLPSNESQQGPGSLQTPPSGRAMPPPPQPQPQSRP